jgi:hypothetical protein
MLGGGWVGGWVGGSKLGHYVVNKTAAAARNAQAATVNITSFTSLWVLSTLHLSSSRTRASAHGSMSLNLQRYAGRQSEEQAIPFAPVVALHGH